jgi:O-antigen/teichoic acid export membrane protein
MTYRKLSPNRNSQVEGNFLDFHAPSRTRRLAAAVFSGAGVRITSALVTVFSLPLAVRYLGAERYGIWVTISSSAVLLNLLDLGISGALTNQIAYACAEGDQVRAARATTSALVLTSAFALISALALIAVWPWVDWMAILRISPAVHPREVSRTIAAAFALILLGLPASLTGRILAGYQEVHRSNLLVAAGTVLNLAGLLLGIKLTFSMPLLFLLATGWITLCNLAALTALLFWRKSWLRPRLSYLSWQAALSLLGSGAGFWLIQISAAVVFSSDNLVVSHYLGPAQVTPYSVTWRLMGVAAILQGLLFPALWPAYAEAYARRDHAWLLRAFRMNLQATFALNLAFALTVVVFGRALIGWWAGSAAVPTLTLLIATAVWAIISGCMTAESCLLAAVNRTREQGVLSIVAAGINLALSVFLVQRIGAVGVIAGTILSYLLVLVVPQTLIVRRVLSTFAGKAQNAPGTEPPATSHELPVTTML